MNYNTTLPTHKARKTSAGVGMKGAINAAAAERNGGTGNDPAAPGMKGSINPAFARRDGEKATSQRPAIYFALVNGLFPYPDNLDAACDRPQNRNEPHVLPSKTLANVVMKTTPPPRDPRAPVEDHPIMEWHDTLSGGDGIGAISLVAHKLKISEEEAAYRLARFISADSDEGARL